MRVSSKKKLTSGFFASSSNAGTLGDSLIIKGSDGYYHHKAAEKVTTVRRPMTGWEKPLLPTAMVVSVLLTHIDCSGTVWVMRSEDDHTHKQIIRELREYVTEVIGCLTLTIYYY